MKKPVPILNTIKKVVNKVRNEEKYNPTVKPTTPLKPLTPIKPVSPIKPVKPLKN